MLLAGATPDPAKAGQGGHVQTGLAIPSVLLGRDIPYALFLPQIASGPARPLPVLYLLHGLGDSETTWLDKGHIASTLDRLVAAGTIPPIAVVMPMAANSWYVDDARGNRGFGAFATAFVENFMPAVEARHNLASCRHGRAVGGLSMGGYGAILYAFTHPEKFTGAISLSGSLWSDLDADIEARKPFFDRVLPGIHGEPFDAKRFRSWTVFQRLEKAPEKSKSLGLWLVAGDGDFEGILSGTTRLHLELKRRRIESHLRIYGGDHNWELWSMAIGPALTWLAPRLDASCKAQ